MSNLPFPILLADIGGTYVRFGVLQAPERVLSRLVKLETAARPAGVDAIRDALAQLGCPQPRSAMLAVAGRVADVVVQLTNGSWVIDAQRIGAAFNLEKVVLMNDYVPVAASVFSQAKLRVAQVGPDIPPGDGNRVVVGPGTGLGAAALISSGGRYHVHTTEAGHTDFGATEEGDFTLWPHLERVGGRITAESVLSGPGLERLYRAVATLRGEQATELTARDIIKDALVRPDGCAGDALGWFVRLLGRFAGDLALVFGATGGVYMAGGIVPRIISTIRKTEFRQSFENKHPFQSVMVRTPTFVITESEPAMSGLAILASRPDEFAYPRQLWSRPYAAA